MNDKNYLERRVDPDIDFSIIYENPKYLKRALNIYDSLWASTCNGSYRILDLLNDINMAIVECNFNDSVLRSINLWKQGYTESQVAGIVGISQQSVHEQLVGACRMISMRLSR